MKYNRSTHEVEIAVSDLCKSNSGDLSGLDTFGGAFEHPITQEMLCLKYEHSGIKFSIRAECVIFDNMLCEIVISDSTGKLPRIKQHTAIAAFVFCSVKNKDDILIESVAIDQEGSNCTTNVRKKTRTSLEAFFLRRLILLIPIAKMLCDRGENVLPLSMGVKFPYPTLRNGQHLMMSECYEAMSRGRRLFVQAPTGIGKTLSVLYPTVKFLGNGKCDKIFYLTAKSSTQLEAYRAAKALFLAGAQLRTIVLSAKAQLCFMQDYMGSGMCDIRCCKYARCSETALQSAINELLALQNGYEQSIISAIALKYNLCPYELSICLAEYCEIVIADYNYVFNPTVYLKRFFSDNERADRYVFLIDEAHNLVDRARDMYSAELSNDTLLKLKNEVKDALPEIALQIEAVLNRMLSLRELCSDTFERDAGGVERGYYLSRERYDGLDECLEILYRSIGFRLRRGSSDPFYKTMSEIYRAIYKYLIASNFYLGSSVFYCEIENERITIKSICVDPSSLLDLRMKEACSTILFSATLTPLEYFKDILGGGTKSGYIAIKSPFDEDNLFLATVDDVSTRYEDRHKSIPRIVSYIASVASCKKGNYMVYFPSYEYMHNVVECFEAKYPSVRILVQKKRMTRNDREEFLNEFKSDDGKMRVGFCVLGGSFSEGIDLPGSALIGVVIIGVGIPGISGERNIIRDHFEVTRETGYDYAYTYPGMNNVLQAAGRVIRSNTDCGVVVLVDDRYSTPKYISMYPEHWLGMKYFRQPASLNAEIKRFWCNISSKNAKK